jgi:flagellar M-ring protein FliF
VNPRMAQTLGRARSLMSGFTPGQRGVIVVAALALVLGAVGLTRWAAQPTWAPLYTNLSGPDASAIVDALTAQNVPYQLSEGGATVLVPQAQVYDLRVSLAGKNLQPSDSGGWSVLDKQGMTTTDFQQNIAYQRAMEGELAKTLQAIQGVNTAIVHLAIPKKDVFSSKQDKSTASVLLALTPGTTLGKTQIRAVTHLVAGSVAGLSPSEVTVTDAQGNLLSTREDGTSGAASLAGDADQQTAQFEDRVSSSLQLMLDRVLGPGHAVVRVNAQLNYDTRETTTQSYASPTPLSPLSEATATEAYNGNGSGAGGPLGQTWPTLAPGGGATGSGAYAKAERTVDNAVGSVLEKAQAAPGSIQRLTVAVVLDAKTVSAADPAKVQQLVASAVGIDPKRGDVVQVDKIAFDTTAAQQAAKELAGAQQSAQTAQYLDLGKKAGIGLVVLLALLMSWRRRKKDAASVQAIAGDLPGGGQPLLLPPHLQAALEAGPEAAADALGENTVTSQLERDRLREEVAAFVDSQPDDIAQLVQGWLSERKA